jgi:hypothetical protein
VVRFSAPQAQRAPDDRTHGRACYEAERPAEAASRPAKPTIPATGKIMTAAWFETARRDALSHFHVGSYITSIGSLPKAAYLPNDSIHAQFNCWASMDGEGIYAAEMPAPSAASRQLTPAVSKRNLIWRNAERRTNFCVFLL